MLLFVDYKLSMFEIYDKINKIFCRIVAIYSGVHFLSGHRQSLCTSTAVFTVKMDISFNK